MKKYSLIFLFFVLFCACKKEEVDKSVQQLDVEEIRNYVKGEEVFYNISEFTEKVWQKYDVDSLKEAQFSLFSDTSVKFSYVTDTTYKITRLVLDYGTKGFMDTDGLKKKGKITFLFNGKYQQINSSCVIELSGFYQDTIAVKGKNTITFLENDTIFSKIEGGQLVFSSSKTANWSSQKKRIVQNDTICFYGKASGKSITGVNYELEIDNNHPEKMLSTCTHRIPLKGQSTITFSNKLPSRLVNYGDGNCDNQVTITIGLLDYVVILD